ncbi:hypothetical protein [Hydrogenophaga sp.]|nr:hypothetical protein [Hydrogenophaga sp.]
MLELLSSGDAYPPYSTYHAKVHDALALYKPAVVVREFNRDLH